MFGLSLRSALLLGSVLLLWCGLPGAARAQASDVCERALAAAEDQYRDAAYDEALRLVSACLNQSDRSPAQAIQAYRRLALIHLKRDELDQARAAVVNLLGLDRSYEADPVTNPPAYVSLVSIVKQDLETTAPTDTTLVAEPRRKPFFRRTSTWVTMGTVVVGSGVLYFTLGGGSSTASPDELPRPPGTPQ